MIHRILPFIILIAMSSCLAYKPLPGTTSIKNPQLTSARNISIVYSPDPLITPESNHKLYKKTQRKEVWFIPVRVVNNDTRAFVPTSENIEVIADFERADIVAREEYYPQIKYKALPCFIWLGAGLLGSFSYSTEGINYKPFNPFSLLFLPGAYYAIRNHRWNKELNQETELKDVLNRTLAPGEVLEGYLCIRATQVNQLTIRLRP